MKQRPVFKVVGIPFGGDWERNRLRLRALCQNGLKRFQLQNEPGEIHAQRKRRLKMELCWIEKYDLTSYLMLLVDLLSDFRSLEIPFSYGYGYESSSLVFHLLDLAPADPLRYGLLFQRFRQTEYGAFRYSPLMFPKKHEQEVRRCILKRTGMSERTLGALMPEGGDSVTNWENECLYSRRIFQDSLLNRLKNGVENSVLSNHDGRVDASWVEIFRNDDLSGISMFSSDSVRRWLGGHVPLHEDDLINCLALEVLEERNKELWDMFFQKRPPFFHLEEAVPAIRKILQPTRGLFVYDVQVMELLREIGGIAYERGDWYLRRGFTREFEKQVRMAFMKGGLRRGYDPAVLDELMKVLRNAASTVTMKSIWAADTEAAIRMARWKAGDPDRFKQKLNEQLQDRLGPICLYQTGLLLEPSRIRLELVEGKDIDDQSVPSLMS